MKIIFLVIVSLLIQHIVYTKDTLFRRVPRVLFNLMVFMLAALVIGVGHLLYGEITFLELFVFISVNSFAIMLIAVLRVLRAVRRRRHMR